MGVAPLGVRCGVEPFKNDIATDAGTSALKDWDPVKQELAWERPNPGAWNSGTLTTAGLSLAALAIVGISLKEGGC